LICIFPDPYPDELLYSVCARYKDLMQYPNNTTATRDFFGDGAISAVVDLPNRLEHLVSALPLGHYYTVDEFIDRHTMFPFYAPFLSCERACLIRDDMRRIGENRIFERIGNPVSHFARPSWLRFCPACVEVDRRDFGESYWHRMHQISGIEVCPNHAIFLETSSASFCNSNNPGVAISAESVMEAIPIRPLNLADDVHSVLLSIARNAAWLLEWSEGKFGSEKLRVRERYYNLLLRRGLAYYNGRVRASRLVKELSKYYPSQILLSLDCEIKDTYRNWLLRLLHSGLTEVSQHPIRHILLIIFLGCTVEDFFTSHKEYKPFGDGPWPCLNKAAEHFGQLVITECRITDNLVKGKKGKPMGTFNCSCGFVYNRVGPDESEQDRTRRNSVEAYGPVWEEALREVWADTSISLSKAASQLGVSELTVIRYAIRLDLPMNCSNTRTVGPKTIKRFRNFRRSRKESLEHYRKEWLFVLAANPNASREQLISTSAFLYMWLGKNDSDWLETHLPPVRKGARKAELKDWASIDNELAAAVKATGQWIREMPGRPIRISLAAITREVGHKSWLEFRLHKLPLTFKALKDCLETVEDVLIRRVVWAEDWYAQNGLCPTRHSFEAWAGTINKSGKMPAVQNAIDGAMERLSKELR
jgi:Tn7-like transposition protein D/TniQ protein